MTKSGLKAKGAWGSGLERKKSGIGGDERHPRTGQANQGPGQLSDLPIAWAEPLPQLVWGAEGGSPGSTLRPRGAAPARPAPHPLALTRSLSGGVANSPGTCPAGGLPAALLAAPARPHLLLDASQTAQGPPGHAALQLCDLRSWAVVRSQPGLQLRGH